MFKKNGRALAMPANEMNVMKQFAIKTSDGLESPYRYGEVAVYTESAVKAIVAHGEGKSFLREFQGKPVDPASIEQVSGGATYHTRRMNPQSSTATHPVKFVEVVEVKVQ